MIWKNVNNCLYNITCKSPSTLKQTIENMTKVYMASRILPSVAEHNTREGWFPPPRDCIKINVHAAFCSSSGETSLGVVARNKEAEVCFSTVTKLQGWVTFASRDKCNLVWSTGSQGDELQENPGGKWLFASSVRNFKEGRILLWMGMLLIRDTGFILRIWILWLLSY